MSKSVVVVDALNFLHRFVRADGPPSKPGLYFPWKGLADAHDRVRALLRAFERSVFKPVFVVDAGFVSPEAVETWRKRREQEVRREHKGVGFNADMSLVAILLHLGADVMRPQGVDADDAIASLAVSIGALVLSGDSDFLRYVGLPQDRLFENFHVKHGKLELVRRTKGLSAAKARLPARDLLPFPLDLGAWRAASRLSKLTHDEDEPFYLRGNADGLTKIMGNLHAVAAPVRHAVFAAKGVNFVYEEFPLWNGKEACWSRSLVDTSASNFEGTLDASAIFKFLRDSDPVAPGVVAEAQRDYSRIMMAAELASTGDALQELRLAASLAGDVALRLARALSLPEGKRYTARGACATVSH